MAETIRRVPGVTRNWNRVGVIQPRCKLLQDALAGRDDPPEFPRMSIIRPPRGIAGTAATNALAMSSGPSAPKSQSRI